MCATRINDPDEDWNTRTAVDDLNDRTEELQNLDLTQPADDEPSEEPGDVFAASVPSAASAPVVSSSEAEASGDTNMRPAVRATGGQSADAMFQKSRQLFRDAVQDLRAGRLSNARMNLKLASTYAPDQLSPRALNTLLSDVSEVPELERAWSEGSLVQRFALAAAFKVPIAQLRDVLEVHAVKAGVDPGRPTTVEQLLDIVSRVESAGGSPRDLDDPVPFSRVAPRSGRG
jgi:hypothetical protein